MHQRIAALIGRAAVTVLVVALVGAVALVPGVAQSQVTQGVTITTRLGAAVPAGTMIGVQVTYDDSEVGVVVVNERIAADGSVFVFVPWSSIELTLVEPGFDTSVRCVLPNRADPGDVLTVGPQSGPAIVFETDFNRPAAACTFDILSPPPPPPPPPPTTTTTTASPPSPPSPPAPPSPTTPTTTTPLPPDPSPEPPSTTAAVTAPTTSVPGGGGPPANGGSPSPSALPPSALLPSGSPLFLPVPNVGFPPLVVGTSTGDGQPGDDPDGSGQSDEDPDGSGDGSGDEAEDPPPVAIDRTTERVTLVRGQLPELDIECDGTISLAVADGPAAESFDALALAVGDHQVAVRCDDETVTEVSITVVEPVDRRSGGPSAAAAIMLLLCAGSVLTVTSGWSRRRSIA